MARAIRLVPMTGDVRELVAAAKRCLEAAWRDGFAYVKAGVLLDDLCPPGAAPPCLFDQPRPGSATLIVAVDRVNARFERGRWSRRRSGSSGPGRSVRRTTHRGTRRGLGSCR